MLDIAEAINFLHNLPRPVMHRVSAVPATGWGALHAPSLFWFHLTGARPTSHQLQDLKLENLLLVKYKDPKSGDKRLVAKLADFGLLVVS